MTSDAEASPRRSPLRGATLAVTNLTKLAGLIIAMNESVIRAELRPVAMAVATVMMAGATVSEQLLLALLDRILGRETK